LAGSPPSEGGGGECRPTLLWPGDRPDRVDPRPQRRNPNLGSTNKRGRRLFNKNTGLCQLPKQEV